MVNEKLKNLSNDQLLLLGDILGYEIDSAESYSLNDTVGEINNSIYNSGARKFTGGNSWQSFINQGHLNRLMSYNNDATNITANKIIFNTGGSMNATSFLNSLSQGLVGAYDSTSTLVPANGQSANR